MSAFKPAWWLPNAHFQTIWPTLFRRRTELICQLEQFELPDGDFIDLAWAGQGKGPLIILLHGLEGSLESTYAKGMLAALTKQGWRGLFMHFRSCSGKLNRLPRTYHSGDTHDLDLLVHALQKREPQTPMAAVGFSLGGNVLLKWLGETGKKNPLVAAVAISVPFELHKAVQKINHGFSRIYQHHLLGCLQKKIKWKFNHATPPFTLPPP